MISELRGKPFNPTLCDNMLIFQGLKEVNLTSIRVVPVRRGRKFRRVLMNLLSAGVVYSSKLFHVGGNISRTHTSQLYLDLIS